MSIVGDLGGDFLRVLEGGVGVYGRVKEIDDGLMRSGADPTKTPDPASVGVVDQATNTRTQPTSTAKTVSIAGIELDRGVINITLIAMAAVAVAHFVKS